MSSSESSSKPDWLSLKAPSLASTALPKLTGLEAPAPPTFPTLFQLAAEAQTTPLPAPSVGLFEALIGDPTVLYQELLEDPARFDPEVADLLQLLVAGQKKLDELEPNERLLLDAAVVDFASPKSQPEPQKLPPEPKADQLPAALEHVLNEQEALDDDSVELEWHEGGKLIPLVDVPDEPPPTHWWKNQ